MDSLLTILDTLVKYVSQIDTNVMLTFVFILLGIIVRNNKKQFEATDKLIGDLSKSVDTKIAKLTDKFTESEKETKRQIQGIKEDLVQIRDITLVDLADKQLENQKLTLRALITNVTLPREYRLRAFDEYKAANGNSWVEDYVQKHLKNQKTDEE